MATTVAPNQIQEERRDALAGRLLQSFQGAADMLAVYLGDRLGYYRALADHGPATSAELAARTRSNERYAREWLEQQAATAVIDVDVADKDAKERRYTLPEGHAEVLADADSLSYMTPLAMSFAAAARKTEELVDAYRTGGGVSWAQFGKEMRESQEAFNKPLFLKQLAQEVIPAIADVHERLRADPAARVADIACGAGWSSIAIAKGYPKVRVDGFDLDAPSIEMARANARDAGVADRVRFEAQDAGAAKVADRYELVTIFEALHDLSQPVEVLRTARQILAKGGTVLVVDERTAEHFTAPADELDRIFYGFSILVCLPDGMSRQPSVGTGTVMRPATMRRYAQEAGFRDIEILPLEPGFFRVYRLLT
ncbi:MAG: class I SAM-dependent methyltransferase [Chloroflexota bacterium]|nr:class I SAM-dependent methyltransferase [Chloroflexota bacterium]